MSVIVPSASYAEGTYSFGPTTIAQGLTLAVCKIDIQDMTTPDKSFLYLAEISYDNGATWGPLTGAQFVGQVVKAGVTVQTNTVTLQQPTSTTRKVRGTFQLVSTVTHVVTTSIDLTVS